jgi:hypothetical protein
VFFFYKHSSENACGQATVDHPCLLKELSHEIDFDKIDKNLRMLAILFPANAKIMPIAAVVRLIS